MIGIGSRANNLDWLRSRIEKRKNRLIGQRRSVYAEEIREEDARLLSNRIDKLTNMN